MRALWKWLDRPCPSCGAPIAERCRLIRDPKFFSFTTHDTRKGEHARTLVVEPVWEVVEEEKANVFKDRPTSPQEALGDVAASEDVSQVKEGS